VQKTPPSKSPDNIRQLKQNAVFSPTLLTCPTCYAIIFAENEGDADIENA
jgi:hypothetical protein